MSNTLEDMVVRLVGDATSYLEMLTKARKATEDFDQLKAKGERVTESLETKQEAHNRKLKELNVLLEKGAISQETFNRALQKLTDQNPVANFSQDATTGMKAASGAIAGGVYAVTNLLSVANQQFDTTGQSMTALGKVASVIPGPWGEAVSSILSAGGMLVDFFQRKLLVTQAAVRTSMQAIASGATSIAGAFSGIETTNLQRGIEQVVRIRQARERGDVSSALGGEVGEAIVRFGPQFARERPGERFTPEEAVRMAARSRIRTQTQALREEVNDPGMRRDLLELAGVQVGSAALAQAVEMPVHLMHRRMFRVMHGEGGDEATVARMTEQMMVAQAQARLRSETGRDDVSYEEARVALGNRLVQTQRQNIQNMRAMRVEHAIQGVSDSTKQITEQASASARASSLFQGFEESVDGTRDAMGQATTTAGHWQRQTEINTMVLQRRDAIERLSLANATNMDAGTRRQIQRQLEQSQAAIENARVTDAARTAQELHQQVMEAGYRTTVSMRQPVDTLFYREQELAQQFREGAINIITYTAALRAARDTYQSTIPQVQQYQSAQQQIQAGLGIIRQHQTLDEAGRQEQYAQQVQNVNAAYREGRVTRAEYERALTGIAIAQERANQAAHASPAALSGSSEALSRFIAFQDRLRRPRITPLPVTAGREAREQLAQSSTQVLQQYYDQTQGPLAPRAPRLVNQAPTVINLNANINPRGPRIPVDVGPPPAVPPDIARQTQILRAMAASLAVIQGRPFPGLAGF